MYVCFFWGLKNLKNEFNVDYIIGINHNEQYERLVYKTVFATCSSGNKCINKLSAPPFYYAIRECADKIN